MTDIEMVNRQRSEARDALQEALYEIKRVIVGQDAMLERLLVSLLAGGHVLLEGVPGLAKTLTVKTLAAVLGGSYSRIQFTPDLVPADLVGTRVWRPDTGGFETELGPVFHNFLLADEINRAPAKVQSALLEVMQEQQVTIGGTTYRVPLPFIVMATQNPIESEGTYPLPEAQVDRFLMKIVVDYPSIGEEAAVVGRSLRDPAEVRECLALPELERHARAAQTHRRRPDDDRLRGGAGRCHPAPRAARAGRHEADDRVRGQPPRADRPGPGGPRAGAAAGPRSRRARRHPRPGPRRPAPPHRAVLRRAQRRGHGRRAARAGAGHGPRAQRRPPDPARRRRDRSGRLAEKERVSEALLTPPAARQGPGPIPSPLVEALDLAVTRLVTRTLPGDRRAAGVGLGTELAQLRPYEFGDDVRHLDAAASARTGTPHVRLHVPERALTTWIVLDVSPSMAFGTAQRLKADVAEGAALVFGRLGVRRAGSVGMIAFGAGDATGAAAARLQARDGGPAHARWPREWRPTAATTPRRWPTPCAAPGGWPASRAWWWSSPTSATSATGSGRSARCACATRSWRSRSSIRVRRSCPAVGYLTLIDPETGARLEVNTSRRRVRERFAELERERRAAVARELRRLRVHHTTLSTEEDWLVELGRRLR